MTLEQREKLYHILGMIEGLTWGVEDNQINEGFIGVVEDLDKLLEEDAEPEITIVESDDVVMAQPSDELFCCSCKYSERNGDEPPCCACKHNHPDQYQRRVTDENA